MTKKIGLKIRKKWGKWAKIGKKGKIGKVLSPCLCRLCCWVVIPFKTFCHMHRIRHMRQIHNKTGNLIICTAVTSNKLSLHMIHARGVTHWVLEEAYVNDPRNSSISQRVCHYTWYLTLLGHKLKVHFPWFVEQKKLTKRKVIYTMSRCWFPQIPFQSFTLTWHFSFQLYKWEERLQSFSPSKALNLCEELPVELSRAYEDRVASQQTEDWHRALQGDDVSGS